MLVPNQGRDHFPEPGNDLDRFHGLRARLITAVASEALPKHRVLCEQLVRETVPDLEHDFARVEVDTVLCCEAVVRAGATLMTETRPRIREFIREYAQA